MLWLTGNQIATLALKNGVQMSALTPPSSGLWLVLPRGRMNSFYRHTWKVRAALGLLKWTQWFDCECFSFLAFVLARAAMKRELSRERPDLNVDGVAFGVMWFTQNADDLDEPNVDVAPANHSICWYVEEPRSGRVEDLEMKPWEPQTGNDLSLSGAQWRSCYLCFR